MPVFLLVALLAALPIFTQAQSIVDVANFGAIGDAVQFRVNTTSNSVVVTTTNQFSSADIGKSIEIFDAGTVTTAPECQDMVATITNVVDRTNVHVSQVAQRTLTNTFATVGTDNRGAIQAAVDAASGPETIINIPSGNYLILAQYVPTAFANVGVVLRKGGLRFVGEGTGETVLLSQGAWSREPNRANAAWRGFLFAIVPPITNDFPLNFENLTMDGGVPDGQTRSHNFPASTTTGNGWDETHGAIVVRGGGWQAPTVTQQTWTNVLFRHWRGEMVKSNDGSTNGNLNVINCTFQDGNATAINYYASLNISNCVFSDLFQIGEYYQAYNTNTSYLQSCLMTNISANGWAFNGAKSDSVPFIIRSNTWNLATNGYNGIMTTPGVNITITGNAFNAPNTGSRGNGTFAVVLGASGYQGTWMNSNIVISANSFSYVDQVVQINGAVDCNGANRVVNVAVFDNTVTSAKQTSLLVGYGWMTNVHFYSNVVAEYGIPSNGSRVSALSSGAYGSTFALVDTNNLYHKAVYDLVGVTNSISYSKGSRYQVVYGFRPGTVYVLQDSNASQIPAGAKLLIDNQNTSGAAVPVYLNSAMTLGPVMIGHRESFTFSWVNGAWQPSTATKPKPPLGLRSPATEALRLLK